MRGKPAFRPRHKPVRQNNRPATGEVFSARVRDLASDGRGITSHPCGLTVFVPGVWPGESGRFRFTGMQGRVGSAELLELSEPSPERTTAPCPHHGFGPGQCGGCPWQFMDYDAQLAAKRERVQTAAERITETPVNPIWPSPNLYGYRNRAQLKTDGKVLGFVGAGSHRIAPIDDCLVLSDPNRSTLRQLRARLPNPGWRPGGKHKWTTLDLDENTDPETVQVNGRLPFQQANSAQNERMQNWLARHCTSLDRESRVLELFCGSGNFTRVLAAAGFKHILAVDGSGPATEALEGRRLPAVTVLNRNLFREDTGATLTRRHGPFDVLVLDPPRDGMRELGTLLKGKSKPVHAFYISCNPATLFRDLAVMQSSGYGIREIQPLDQAPHTPHVEVLVWLTLEGK